MSHLLTHSVRFATVAAICLTLRHAAAAGNPVEFSADVQNFTGEGVTYHRMVFKDGNRVIYYQPPNHWKGNVSDGQLTLTPPDGTYAQASIASVPVQNPVVLDDRAATTFENQVMAALPSGNRNATVVKREQNAFLLNNNPTLELTVAYDVFGQSFKRGVILVNTPANQVRFQFTARKNEFNQLYQAFRNSVFTWEWQAEAQQAAVSN